MNFVKILGICFTRGNGANGKKSYGKTKTVRLNPKDSAPNNFPAQDLPAFKN
jgi:hypothetical protein